MVTDLQESCTVRDVVKFDGAAWRFHMNEADKVAECSLCPSVVTDPSLVGQTEGCRVRVVIEDHVPQQTVCETGGVYPLRAVPVRTALDLSEPAVAARSTADRAGDLGDDGSIQKVHLIGKNSLRRGGCFTSF